MCRSRKKNTLFCITHAPALGDQQPLDDYQNITMMIDFTRIPQVTAPCQQIHTAQNLQMRIVDPSQNARVVYDDPWHWQVLPNKNPRTKEQVEMEKTIFQLQERVQVLESQVKASVAFPPLLKRDDRLSSDTPDEQENTKDEDETFYKPTQEDYERAWKKRQELLISRGQRPNWEVEGVAPYLGKR